MEYQTETTNSLNFPVEEISDIILNILSKIFSKTAQTRVVSSQLVTPPEKLLGTNLLRLMHS